MDNVLLDTDIISFYMRNDENVLKNFQEYINNHQKIFISRISVLEILGGLKAKKAERQLQDFCDFLKEHIILEVTQKSIEISSDIFASLHKSDKHSGNYDILIAGIAIENNLVLCTNHIKDYENIENLRIINWKNT